MSWFEKLALRIAVVMFGGVFISRFILIPAIVAEKEALHLFGWNESRWVSGLTEMAAAITGILVVLAIIAAIRLIQGPNRFLFLIVLVLFIGYFAATAILAFDPNIVGSHWERFCGNVLFPIGIISAVVLVASSAISGFVSGMSGK